MSSTKRKTLGDLFRAFAPKATQNNFNAEIQQVNVKIPATTATATFPLYWGQGPAYLHSVQFLSETTNAASQWSIQLQNASTDGSGSTAIGSAATGATVINDNTVIYAPTDPLSSVIKDGEVVIAVCTRTGGTLQGTFVVNYIRILD